MLLYELHIGYRVTKVFSQIRNLIEKSCYPTYCLTVKICPIIHENSAVQSKQCLESPSVNLKGKRRRQMSADKKGDKKAKQGQGHKKGIKLSDCEMCCVRLFRGGTKSDSSSLNILKDLL